MAKKRRVPIKGKKKSRLLSLSKDDIWKILKSLNSKLSNPLFYTSKQLSAMRKRQRDLEARLDDILDEEIYEKAQNESSFQDGEVEGVYRKEQSRRGKAVHKVKDERGFRVRPGPKANLSYRAKRIREKRKEKGLHVKP